MTIMRVPSPGLEIVDDQTAVNRHVVAEAGSAAAALDAVEHHEPTAMLLDVRLGDEDGFARRRVCRSCAPPPRHPRLVIRRVAAIVCAALLAAAVLVPAPAVVLPFMILACLGCPMAAGHEPARTLAAVGDPAGELRRELDRLPEAPHPLGL